MKRPPEHQYIDRETGHIRTERLYGDQLLNALYRAAWEKAPTFYHLLTSARFSHLLGIFCYDSALGARLSGNQRFLRACRVNLDECIDPPYQLDTVRKVFERKIRYWDCRPLPEETHVVSPADARVIVGSFKDMASFFLKEKFFHYDELLDPNKTAWVKAFTDGEFALFRLTPDKYHYNHTPVAGVVRDFYEIPGNYHSCNPSFLVASAFPYAKNKRVVTIIETDVPDGSQVGLVAMIEIVALMIGDIVQCYSQTRYDEPCSVSPNMFLLQGQPKSLYRPGSSTTVLLFQQHRLQFAEDLVRNRCRPNVKSRFSQGLGRSLIETDVKVRSPLAFCRQRSAKTGLK